MAGLHARLAKAIEVLGEEVRAYQTSANGDASDFSVRVDGPARNLLPILRDEIYRITVEALRNAFHHARARRIELKSSMRHGSFALA